MTACDLVNSMASDISLAIACNALFITIEGFISASSILEDNVSIPNSNVIDFVDINP